jgi:hypothetical protein
VDGSLGRLGLCLTGLSLAAPVVAPDRAAGPPRSPPTWSSRARARQGSKFFGSTYLDVARRKSRAAQLTLPALVASPCGPGWDRTLDIAPEWDTVKNGVRNGDVRRLGVAPVPHAPSTREGPLDPTFDQWEGNSEILRARCAEKGLPQSYFPHISADFSPNFGIVSTHGSADVSAASAGPRDRSAR